MIGNNAIAFDIQVLYDECIPLPHKLMDSITKTAKVPFSSLGIKSPCAGWKKKEIKIEEQWQVVNDNTGEIVYTGNLLQASEMRSWYNLKHENIDNGIFFSTKYANSGEK